MGQCPSGRGRSIPAYIIGQRCPAPVSVQRGQTWANGFRCTARPRARTEQGCPVVLSLLHGRMWRDDVPGYDRGAGGIRRAEFRSPQRLPVFVTRWGRASGSLGGGALGIIGLPVSFIDSDNSQFEAVQLTGFNNSGHRFTDPESLYALGRVSMRADAHPQGYLLRTATPGASIVYTPCLRRFGFSSRSEVRHAGRGDHVGSTRTIAGCGSGRALCRPYAIGCSGTYVVLVVTSRAGSRSPDGTGPILPRRQTMLHRLLVEIKYPGVHPKRRQPFRTL